jgi:thymidine phosphorylase
MLFKELILKKRLGKELTKYEINWFISNLTSNHLSEGQIASLAMAICLKGMTFEERVQLTLAMKNSGKTLSWDLPGPIIDKHSTGGVGDTVSLILAPVLAACGAYVPMISGRGLGHTGGTLDKFDSIPGYNTSPNEELLRRVVSKVGCAIIGQTNELAPADKRLYAIRDVTGTVESIDLITASILSKKLAAGLEGLVIDVKCGNGAFMQDFNEASTLAKSLVTVANEGGCKTTALVTDMNQPLSQSIGNSLEVLAAIDILKGSSKDYRLLEVTKSLGVSVLCSSNICKNKMEAQSLISSVLSSGKAAEKFSQMISELGGANDFFEKPKNYLTPSNIKKNICCKKSGYVKKINTKNLGNILILLGGGRQKVEDDIDFSVGMKLLIELDTYVEKNQPICTLYARDEVSFNIAEKEIIESFEIDESEENFNKKMIIEQFE